MSKIIQKRTVNKRKTTPVANFVVSNNIENPSIKDSLWLYRFVYTSKVSLFAVSLLFLSFCLQNIDRVYADENESLSPETVVLSVEVEDEVPTVQVDITSDISEVEAQIELPELPEVAESLSEEEINETQATTSGTSSPLVMSNIYEEEDKAEISASSTSQTENVTEIPEGDNANSDTSVAELYDSQESNSSSTAEYEVQDEDGDVADSTQLDLLTEDEEVLIDQEFVPDSVNDEAVINNESVSVTESDSEFSFSKNECTELASGSFYCREPNQNQLKDALFSAPDADGDLEIFIVRDGIQAQVTSNQMDDAAPYYDLNSNTIVWHRLIDDRYQIISYDVETEKETKLTDTNQNNMEPTRQGDYTVWQRWISGGWNIILFDGENETQITKNTDSNVAPYIHGSLIVWNSRNQVGDKTIQMYDIQSKTYVTVDDPEGMSVSNPRMVFVYDSLHPNGDIVTKGYDVLAHKFINLDTLPRELPEELPESDSTGETRALIQAKPSVKSEIEESTGSTTNPNILTPVLPELATSSDIYTLDLSQSTSTDDVDLDGNTPAEETTEFDLVIEPVAVVASSSTSSEPVQE